MQDGTHRSSPLARWRGKLWNSPLPTLGCEISHLGISVARWSRNSSGLETAAWKPIPAGAVEASPIRENIQQPEEVRRSFAEALASLGISPAPDSSGHLIEVVLVIPDQAARLFVLNFDTFPERHSEGLPLVKWRLKKSVPFDIESAAISHFVQRSGTELQVVAVATPRWIIRQYEAVAENFGLRPRWVVLSTLASLGLANELEANLPLGENRDLGGQAGVLVAKYNPPWFTTAILQGETLRLFRTVGLAADGDGLLSSAGVLAAMYPSVAYFQDNFQGPLERGYLCGLGENSASIAATLELELNLRTSPLVCDPNGTDCDSHRAERNWGHGGRSLTVEALAGAGIDPRRAEQQFAALLGIVREQRSR